MHGEGGAGSRADRVMFINESDEVAPEFATAIVKLASAYQMARLTDIGIRVYARALNDCSMEAVSGAFGRAVRECKFFPTVAELRSFIRPSADDAALLAWTALERAAVRIGGFQSLVLEDAAAAHALTAVFGSWPTYCETDGSHVASRKTEFMAAYREGQRAARRASVRLAGICEASGKYVHGGQCWAGIVRRSGEVVPAREDELKLLSGDGQRSLPEKK